MSVKLVVNICLVAAVVFIVWIIISGGLNKGSAAVINPLKDMFKEESEKQNEKKIKQDLLENSRKVSLEVAKMIDGCVKENDDLCNCDAFDLTELNEHHLKLTNDKGHSYSQLLDSQFVPLKDGNKELTPYKKPTGGVEYILFSNNGVQHGVEGQQPFIEIDAQTKVTNCFWIKRILHQRSFIP